MATSNAALPPLGQISIIGTWAETVLYGINCVMYVLCMFILLRGSKTTSARRLLIVMSTVLFILCTAHVAASLRQLLEAFVWGPPNVPNYSIIYWLDNTNPVAVLKNYLYDTLVFAQYCILIWRLYVVFMGDWRILILPIILLIGCMSALYAISVVLAFPGATLHDSVSSRLVESAWVLDMVLNVGITGTIATRLWWMGRKTASLMPTRTNPYATSVYVLVESGAIFVINNLLILAFYASKSPAALTIIDVVAQSAALTPFLIVVQVGLTGRYRIQNRNITSDDSSNTALTSRDDVALRVGTFRKQDLQHPHYYVSPAEVSP